MITLVPVTFDHVKELQRRHDIFFTLGSDEQARQIVSTSIGFTMMQDGKILGCCGAVKMWRGVGTWWMVLTDELKSHPRLLLVTAREIVDKIAQNYSFHRFEVFMDPELKKHIRFVEALGFTFEGRLVKHAVDQTDHLLYAKIY